MKPNSKSGNGQSCYSLHWKTFLCVLFIQTHRNCWVTPCILKCSRIVQSRKKNYIFNFIFAQYLTAFLLHSQQNNKLFRCLLLCIMLWSFVIFSLHRAWILKNLFSCVFSYRIIYYYSIKLHIQSYRITRYKIVFSNNINNNHNHNNNSKCYWFKWREENLI